MRRLSMLAVAATLGSIGFLGAPSASAHCTVNIRTCSGGHCIVNAGSCSGHCAVNTGRCDSGAVCTVNVGTCTTSFVLDHCAILGSFC